MEDLATRLYAELKGIFGPVVAIVVSVSVYLWSQRNQSKKSDADAGGQIEALDVYKELLKTEREARHQESARADQFAKERNEAYQQVWELKGQLKAMSEQMAVQNLELVALRDQLRELKEQIDANS